MKYLPALIALLTAFCHPEGTSAQSLDLGGGTTRAVVVGISDYQAPAIPDLQFADRDANAFADWLRSPAGGGVPEANITLLTNAEATGGKFAMALTGLIDDCKPGEQAIIYFSGHGDVETKTVFQLGFLLCHDSPASNYMGGGFNLVNLQAVISTLAANGVQTLVVTDACRAGKLAGAAVNGAQLTNANLAKPWNNEVKILSCQPNEFSIEGEQWGGGRGVFSYHLVEGLTGLADGNGDKAVNLMEIGRYLEERVPTEAAPHPQVPFTVGDRMARVSQVDADALALLEMDKSRQATSFKTTGMRGLGDALLSKGDSAMYRAFLAALDSGNLMEPAGNCADDFYRHLVQVESLRPVWGLMRRNFAAALQDEVQQALNALMESDPYEANAWRYNPGKYEKYPEFLQRSMELLGETHYMYKTLKAKKLYFEAHQLGQNMGAALDVPALRDSLKREAKAKLLQAAQLEPGAAYLYHAIGSLYYFTSPPQTDSMLAWNARASEWSPRWLLPYLDNSYEVNRTTSNVAEAERWLMQALAADSNAYVVLERLSWLYQWQGKTQQSLDLCDRMIALKPDLFNAYSTKGVTHAIRLEWDEAERLFRRSLQMDSSSGNWANNQMINVFITKRRLPEAIDWVQKIWDTPGGSSFADTRSQSTSYLVTYSAIRGLDLDYESWANKIFNLNPAPVIVAANQLALGIRQVQIGNDEEGRELLMKCLETNPEPDLHQTITRAYFGIIEARKGNAQLADSLFQEAFRHISPNALDNRHTLVESRFLYGNFLLRQNRYGEARRQFRLAEEYQPRCFQAQYGYALLAAADKRQEEALDYLEKALDLWYPREEPILAEPLFKKIRKTKRFKLLMKKHFNLSL